MTGRRENAREVYAEIIGLPHWEPSSHPRMSLHERAAQFAPYAALVGYDEMVREEARETVPWTDPGEDDTERLSWALALLSDRMEEGVRPACSVTYFVPDEKKAGGQMITTTGRVKRIDPVLRQIVLVKETVPAGTREEISFDRIVRIEEAAREDEII